MEVEKPRVSCRKSSFWSLIFASPFSWHLLKPFFFISSNLLSSFESYKLQSWKRCYRRDILKTLHAQIVKTKLSCEPSFQNYELKVWHRSFRARPPSQSESGRCENEAFLRVFPQKVRVKDVKTKLSCEYSLTKWKWKMWKRSFPVKLLSKSDGWKCENEAFARVFPQKIKPAMITTKV